MYKKKKKTWNKLIGPLCRRAEEQSELPNEQLNGQVLQPQRLQKKKLPVALHLSL